MGQRVLDVRQPIEGVFFFFLNGFIEPFCLIKISRCSLHFACKTPAKGFNYFSARRAA